MLRRYAKKAVDYLISPWSEFSTGLAMVLVPLFVGLNNLPYTLDAIILGDSAAGIGIMYHSFKRYKRNLDKFDKQLYDR